VVEYSLGKGEVVGSIPIISSTFSGILGLKKKLEFIVLFLVLSVETKKTTNESATKVCFLLVTKLKGKLAYV
jgi:hypothetical protein